MNRRSGLKRAAHADAVRERIVQSGIELFLSKGFEATTVEMIAAKAGISRRSLFRYFATKEDIVLIWTASTGPALIACLNQQTARRDPLTAALQAVERHVAESEDTYALALQIGRLIAETPTLKARSYEKYYAWEQMLALALIECGALAVNARMASAVAVSGLRLAVQAWIDVEGRQTISNLLEASYATLRQSLTKGNKK